MVEGEAAPCSGTGSGMASQLSWGQIKDPGVTSPGLEFLGLCLSLINRHEAAPFLGANGELKAQW